MGKLKIKKHLFRSCPICLNSTGEVLLTQHFESLSYKSLPDYYNVVVCTKCGFVYADTPAKQRDYTQYYQNQSKYENVDIYSGSGRCQWDAGRLKRTAKDISLHLPDKNAFILDIGCASGGLLVELKNLGFHNLIGLDPSKNCVRKVESYGIKAFQGDLLSIGSIGQGKKFDCIILSQVLEHVYDLQTTVRRVVRKLNNSGLLYVEVPDASAYLDYYIVPYHYFDQEHINHFDKHSLNNLLLKKNFNLEFLGSGKKEVRVSDDNVYAVFFGFYRKQAVNFRKKHFLPNYKLRRKVLDYIKKSKKENTWPVIERLAKSKAEVVIWGVGSYTLRLLKDAPLGKCNIKAFIDKDPKKIGTKVRNISIYGPDMLRNYKGIIIVSSAIYSNDIVEEIRKRKLGNKIIVMN